MRACASFMFIVMAALIGAPAPVLAGAPEEARLACPEPWHTPAPTAMERKDCSKAANQIELNECMFHRRIQSEVSLRNATDLLLTRLEPAESDHFKRAQAAWCAYRDAACEFDAPSGAAGSMIPQLHHQCRAARNAAREKAIVTLSECIAHGDCERPLLFFVYEVGPGSP